ncbi:MAG: SpoIID/LytB domain-containing protein [Actinobacteria bacterium]|nr:SpoIID/LytB domain-containing protein [Actinomycetota bacterium]
MWNRLLTIGAASALVLTAGAPASMTRAADEPAVGSGPTFVFTGRGWGHGVGMSQYGALGFARRGTPYSRILSHYYPGTELSRASTAQVRVLLAEGRSSVKLSSAAAFRVRDASAKIHRLDPGEYQLGPGLKLKVKGARKATALPGPLAFLPGDMPLHFGRPYRGWLQVASNGRKLSVVNTVGLEAYLYGVVPDEVPDTWPAEALKAQAVAARSYAMATRKIGGPFDLYADTRSQVYGGVDAESFPTTAAVDATAGRVLNYRGRPAVTYFFSTSGGRTAAIQDAWPGARPVPYLVSVADPYDSLSPHHRWGPLSFSAKPLLRRLKVPGQLLDLKATPNPSGRITSVTAVSTLGSLSIPAGDVRRLLDLRSTWFRVGVLSLTRPAAPAVHGSAVRVSGIARGLPGVTLQQRVSGSVWEPASRIKPASDGTFSVSVKPQAGSEYRLVSGRTSSGSVRVSVAPLVRFFLARDTGMLRGMVRPILPGAIVQIQQLAGPTWKTVEQLPVDAKGNFQPKLKLPAGTYRARFAPGRGLAPGTSPVLKVVA